jgi:hypothetical protein
MPKHKKTYQKCNHLRLTTPKKHKRKYRRHDNLQLPPPLEVHSLQWGRYVYEIVENNERLCVLYFDRKSLWAVSEDLTANPDFIYKSPQEAVATYTNTIIDTIWGWNSKSIISSQLQPI